MHNMRDIAPSLRKINLPMTTRFKHSFSAFLFLYSSSIFTLFPTEVFNDFVEPSLGDPGGVDCGELTTDDTTESGFETTAFLSCATVESFFLLLVVMVRLSPAISNCNCSSSSSSRTSTRSSSSSAVVGGPICNGFVLEKEAVANVETRDEDFDAAPRTGFDIGLEDVAGVELVSIEFFSACTIYNVDNGQITLIKHADACEICFQMKFDPYILTFKNSSLRLAYNVIWTRLIKRKYLFLYTSWPRGNK